MPDYALTAAALRRWQELELPEDPRKQVDFWADLLDEFGPALLPFVLKPKFIPRVPYKILGIEPIDVGGMTPSLGESWLLFCFRTDAPERSEVPVRGDGLMLPCEWRRRSDSETGGHSPLLADSLTALADQVKAELNGADWYLYPSFSRFADKVAFTDPDLFAPADSPELVASAWGALATGLFFVQRGLVPDVWPFSSVQYDVETGRLLPVEGVVRKIAVAAGFRCRVFMVAPSQVTAARAELKLFAASVSEPVLKERLQSVTVVAPVVSKDVGATVEDLATGTVTRKRRRMACGAVCSFLAAAALAFGAWYYAMWVCPTKEYYATAFRCRDGWEGRGRLSESVAAHRVGNVRITREGRRGHVKEVAWVDGLDMPSAGCDIRTDIDDRLMLEGADDWRVRNVRFVLKRESGHLVEERAYDAFGRETYCLEYKEKDGVRRGNVFQNNGALYASRKHQALQFTFAYDRNGMEKEVLYFDAYGVPAVNMDGVYGYAVEYLYDEVKGKTYVTQTFLSTNGCPAYAKDGMARIMSVFDEQWRLKYVAFLGERDESVLCSRGFASASYNYNVQGNQSSVFFSDVKGDEVVIPTSLGPAVTSQFKYSPDLRHRTYIAGLRPRDKLEPVRSVEIELDDYGYIKKRCAKLRMPDVFSDPTVFGVSFARQGYDTVYGRYLNYDEKPCTNSDGIAGFRLNLDADGRIVRQTYVATNGAPKDDKNGLARVENTYQDGSLVCVKGFDAKGDPADKGGRPVKVLYRYDEFKNRVSTEYLGTNGVPALFNKTYSKEICRYSRTRKFLEQSYLLPGDAPAITTNGSSRVLYSYHPVFDKPVWVSYWVGTNRLVNTTLGFASVSNAYDDAGNCIYEGYRDASGRLVKAVGGFAVRKARYNAEGRQVELCYLDENEQPVNDLCGRARYEAAYDFLGTYRGERAFDANNSPRLPLVAFQWFVDEKGPAQPGDILLACDQWRYSRTSRDPMGLSLTNGTVLTGLVLARYQNGTYRQVRSAVPYNYQRRDFFVCYFAPSVEDAILSLVP